jgi:hypothetical protein
MQQAIKNTERAAREAKIEVYFWSDPLPFSFTIFNPESANGKIRVEFPIPGGPVGQAPSVVVYRRTDPAIYADLLAFFKRAAGDKD